MSAPEGTVLEVVCTDRGEHGRRTLGQLRRTAEGVEDVRYRVGATPTGEVEVVDGLPMISHHRGLLPVDDVRDDYDGRFRFRYPCRTCGRDVPLTAITATRLLDGLHDAGQRVVDVSLLP